MTTFAEYLKDARKKAKISQRELASRCGVDFTYISKIERGKFPPPSVPTIASIAHALGADTPTMLFLAGKVPTTLKKECLDHPMLTEILWLLSQHKCSDKVYQRILEFIREWQQPQIDDFQGVKDQTGKYA